MAAVAASTVNSYLCEQYLFKEYCKKYLINEYCGTLYNTAADKDNASAANSYLFKQYLVNMLSSGP